MSAHAIANGMFFLGVVTCVGYRVRPEKANPGIVFFGASFLWRVRGGGC